MADKNNFGLTEKDYLLAECVLKVSAIERLLTKSGLITADGLSAEMSTISSELIEIIKKTVNADKN
jgi:hypothetical protein